MIMLSIFFERGVHKIIRFYMKKIQIVYEKKSNEAFEFFPVLTFFTHQKRHNELSLFGEKVIRLLFLILNQSSFRLFRDFY